MSPTPRDTVLFLHAHPDDEAIFTGGTIAALAEAGHRVVVLIATSGELGAEVPEIESVTVPGRRNQLAVHRREEAGAACRRLGVSRLVFLDHVDSGLEPDRSLRPWGAFADVELETAAAEVAALAAEERAAAIVSYDARGIYGHPDHVHAHRVAHRAADLAGIATRYDVTVDREYLHFVDTHLVGHASGAPPSAGAWGLATVEITATVDVRGFLETKRAAISAHRSQLGGAAWAGVRDDDGRVYGFEWYVREGPVGPIETLVSGAEPVRGDAMTAITTPTGTTTDATERVALGPDELAAVTAALVALIDLEPATGDPSTMGPRDWAVVVTDAFDAWLIRWPTGGAVELHDHGGSAGMVAVLEGELVELRAGEEGLTSEERLPTGVRHLLDADVVHDVVNRGDGVAVSLHVYSPPLETMGFYDDGGRLDRVEVVGFEAPRWPTAGWWDG